MSSNLQLNSFFVDRSVVSLLGEEEAINLFEKNESGYFNSIVSAMCWGLDNIKLEQIDFYFIDKLHKRLVDHIDLEPRIANGPRNFGLKANVNCDETGLREFMSDYYNGNKFYLDMTVYDKNRKPTNRYYTLKGTVQTADPIKGSVKNAQRLTTKQASDFIVEHFFNKRDAEIRCNSMMFEKDTRKEVVNQLGILTQKLTALTKLQSTIGQSKTQHILDTLLIKSMGKLNQFHSFMDGNARLSYVLANIILYKFNLPLFWPNEQSELEMLGEKNGLAMLKQSREQFTKYFGDVETFVTSLRATQLETKVSVATGIKMWQLEKETNSKDAYEERSDEISHQFN